MKFNPEKHHRRSIRLRKYDYSNAGVYFVTICTRNRECLFGDVVDGEMVLNDAGNIVLQTWHALPDRFPVVQLDAFMVMPNHVHGIIVITGAWKPNTTNRGVMNHAPTVGAQFIAPNNGDRLILGEIIRTFKAVTTRRIRQNGLLEFGWQRNYYEHVIRGDDELCDIRKYIAHNPAGWLNDENHPNAGRLGGRP